MLGQLEEVVPQGLESLIAVTHLLFVRQAVPPAPAGTRCPWLLDHMDLARPWMGTHKPRGALRRWEELSPSLAGVPQGSGIHVLTSSGAPLPGKKLPSS